MSIYFGFRFSTLEDVYFNVPPTLIGDSFEDEKSKSKILRIPKHMMTPFLINKVEPTVMKTVGQLSKGELYTISIKNIYENFDSSTEEFDFLIREIQENYTSMFIDYKLSNYGKKCESYRNTIVVLVEGKNFKLEQPNLVDKQMTKFQKIIDDLDLQGKFGFYYQE